MNTRQVLASLGGALVVAALVPSGALAAELIPCPDGAVETDLTLEFYTASCTQSPACTRFADCSCQISNTTCGSSGQSAGEGGACDDGSYRYDVFRTPIWGTGALTEGFPFAFQRWDTIWININGNLSFGGPVSTYTPNAIPGLERPTIAPYFGDVDLTNDPAVGTSNPSRVYLCEDPANQRIMVTWVDVGYYDAKYPETSLNSFQVILTNSGEVCVDPEIGVVDGLTIEYRYRDLVWYVGEASGSLPDGTCAEGNSVEEGGSCVPTVVGFDTGDGVNSFQVEGTRERFANDVLLAGEGGGAVEPGVYRFQLLAGSALPSICGDGSVDLCETCDDGDLNGITCCRTDCSSAEVLETCGGGAGECVIDDPNLICQCEPGYELDADGLVCITLSPTAIAGPDQRVSTSSAVTLDGSASTDPKERPLTYSWAQTGGTTVTLSDPSAASPTFTAPAAADTLTFELTVCNDVPLCSTDTVQVVIVGAPVANAGGNQAVPEFTGTTLDASGSTDPQGQALTFTWTQIGGPEVALSSGSDDNATVTFTSPEGPTTLTFQVQVCNTEGLCSVSSVVVTVIGAPTADAGPAQSIAEGAAGSLDGSSSSDPQGQGLTYTWSQTSGPDAGLSGANTATPTFTAPGGPTSLEFTLEVCNATGLCDTDTVTITVNGYPTASAGDDQTVNEGTTVTLDGSGSTDPQEQPLTTTWTQTGGPEVTLTPGEGGTATFTAPDGPATLTFEVSTCNTAGLCATDTVTVTVIGGPNADAGPDKDTIIGQGITLDGSGSSDPQGQTLTTTWTQTGGPTAEVSGADSATATVTPSAIPGTLTFTLEVCNASGLCDTDEVTIAVGCPAGYALVEGEVASCVDIDECAEGATNNCDALVTCTNTEGGYTCGACPEGYTDVNGDGTLCVDIDECADDATNNCDTLVDCTNTAGSYTCGACPDGYTDVNGDGTLCEDIDECVNHDEPPCDTLVACTNTAGGFTCGACPDGYTDVHGDGTLCEDIDECADEALNDCDASAACTNTPGSFTCGPCPAGTTDVHGDGTVCEDIDECADEALNACDPLVTCTNTAGGYACGACPDGYTDVNGDGTSCTDVDECASAADNACDDNAICSNTAGGYSCACAPGFTGDGTTCTAEPDPQDDLFVEGGGGCSGGGAGTGAAPGLLATLALGALALLRRRRA